MALAIIVCILFFILLLIVRTLILRLSKTELSGYQVDANVDIKRAKEALATAITYKTIASESDLSPFKEFHNHLRVTYPTLFSQLELIDVGEDNLLFKWSGSDSTLLPALLTAHQDVVASLDEKEWEYPPFSSSIAEGFIWGRGSFDDKGPLIALCEAVVTLLSTGFTPQRSYYIAFGCDEEIRGERGAKLIAQYFQQNGIQFEFVLDEGGIVASHFISAITQPVAVVGVAEKQDINIELSLYKEGGHSSTVKNPTSVALLSRAIWRLEKRKPKAQISKPIKMLLHTLGLYAPLPLAVVLLNLWLTKALIVAIFSKVGSLNALIRTTLAVTMVEASNASNVVTNRAKATVNARILPTYSTKKLLSWMKKRIRDARIELKVVRDSGSSTISLTETQSFVHLAKSIKSIFPEAIVTSFLMTGGTDALWYEKLSRCVYRFTPFIMDNGELNRMHNKNERLSVDNLERAILFYTTLITNEIFTEDHLG